jgi:hypothetical protein
VKLVECKGNSMWHNKLQKQLMQNEPISLRPQI